MTTPINPPPAGEPFSGEAYGGPRRRVPWSKSAIAGFVCSLFGCLGITAVAGLILGIIGIANTTGGRRQGRGLAIAAIPISLLLGVLSIIGYLILAMGATLNTIPDRLEAALQPEAFASGEATQIIRQLASSGFNESVTDAELNEWYAAITAKHGRLVKILIAEDGSFLQRAPDNAWRVALKGRFVNGTVDIFVPLKSEGRFGPIRMGNIEIDGLSPRASITRPEEAEINEE
jgi:hypothetical protein